MPPGPRLTAMQKFQAKMDKTYGKDVFRQVGEPQPYEVIPTGSITLDYRLGVGGFIRGRINEVWGPEGAGKTTLSYETMAQAQKTYPDLDVCFVDVEHRADTLWMIAHGIDINRCWIVKPNNAEEVADIVKDVCRSGLFSIIVVDSIGAMIPQKAKDKDADEAVVAGASRDVTRMVQIAHSEADLTKTTVLLLNQIRATIAGGPKAGNSSPGGHALKHSSTTKLYIRRASIDGAVIKMKIDGEERVVGNMVSVQIQRNSVAPAYRTVYFPMLYVPTERYGPVGIDRSDEAATVGDWSGVIEQNGGWYTIRLTGDKVQGWDRVVETIRTKGLADQIRSEALSILRPEVTSVASTAEESWDGGDTVEDETVSE